MTAPKNTRKPAARTTKAAAKTTPTATKAATSTRKTATPKAAQKPAAQPKPAEKTGLVALAETGDRAAKAKATREAAATSDETRKCETCQETKAINKFPTTTANKDGVMGRGKTCRACRDKSRQAAKKR